MLRRSQLYVPANDERKIRKSVSLSADSIIFDLEDAVPQSEKSNARLQLQRLLRELDWGKRELCVRVNKFASGYSDEDFSLAKCEEKIRTIVLPKADDQVPKDLHLKTGKILIPLIETARGLLRVENIARFEGVEALSYGPADLAYSVGGRTEIYTQNLFVKTQIVMAASAYGVDSIDCVYFELSNLDGFRNEAIQSKSLGYAGKQVVHPAQAEIANTIYSPSEEEITEARKIIETYEKSVELKVGALRLDEKLVDAVHYRRAKALLEKARESSNPL
ncbi:MAG: HpcH/HpaI aldolase/citrate lyase family protein [Nitrososphaerales archaeon]